MRRHRPSRREEKAAQESGRRGGLKGGTARSQTLTPERLGDREEATAAARWKTSVSVGEIRLRRVSVSWVNRVYVGLELFRCL